MLQWSRKNGKRRTTLQNWNHLSKTVEKGHPHRLVLSENLLWWSQCYWKKLPCHHARGIVKSMGGTTGFIADKEILFYHWGNKSDVVVVDPSDELLLLQVVTCLSRMRTICVWSGARVRTSCCCTMSIHAPPMSKNAAATATPPSKYIFWQVGFVHLFVRPNRSDLEQKRK